MKRIDQIKNALKGLGSGEKITAAQLAAQLKLTRANVSGDLNRLSEAGIAEKSGSKPVYYCLVNDIKQLPEDSFDSFMQSNSSLYQCGELAKAAVLYPPNGMHIMLLGETGVGKSMIAQMIYNYALSQGRMQSAGGFVAFNCADYANNPQLLVSQLFGVAKGAYTGADTDRPGLLERADGGILFLDEIHRLPPEGQEMLFSYIDTARYRRMGETESLRSARVMLVCATTENPQSSLLHTFNRRIPMIINIPNLVDRTLDERLYLISTFFTGESRRLDAPIHVTLNSMRALLGYSCPGNVGQLKSDIQMLCARSYSDYLTGKKESISITSFALPTHIRDGLFTEENHRNIWARLSGISGRFVVFIAEGQTLPFEHDRESTNIYQSIEQQTEDMRRVGMSQAKIDDSINSILASYYNRFSEGGRPCSEIDNLERFVGSEVIATVDKMMAVATIRLGRSMSENTIYGICIHIDNAIKRIRQGQSIVNPRLNDIQKEHPELIALAQELLGIVQEDFNLRLPIEEAGFLALFFSPTYNLPHSKARVQIIVAAHGTGIATGLAETANRLLGGNTVVGFDVPLDQNPSIVYQQMRAYLEDHSDVQEVMLLVDMGSLVNYTYQLEQDLGIRVKSFILVSTLHVLEAGRKAALGYSLYDVYNDTKKITELTLTKNQPAAVDDKLFLLSVCTTGEGSAKVLKEILTSRLDLKNGLCEVVSLKITDRDDFANRVERLCKAGRLVGVVSSFYTTLMVPHFGLSAVMDGTGLAAIQKKIDLEYTFIQVTHTLISMLKSINGAVAARDIRDIIERIERALRIELDDNMLIGIFCHIGCMLDRLKGGQPVSEYPNKEALLEKYPNEVELIQNEFSQLAELYSVTVPLDEVCCILAFFNRETFVKSKQPANAAIK